MKMEKGPAPSTERIINWDRIGILRKVFTPRYAIQMCTRMWLILCDSYKGEWDTDHISGLHVIDFENDLESREYMESAKQSKFFDVPEKRPAHLLHRGFIVIDPSVTDPEKQRDPYFKDEPNMIKLVPHLQVLARTAVEYHNFITDSKLEYKVSRFVSAATTANRNTLRILSGGKTNSPERMGSERIISGPSNPYSAYRIIHILDHLVLSRIQLSSKKEKRNRNVE